MKTIVYRYSEGSKLLHWLIAFIVILMLSVSFFLSSVPQAYKPTAYMIHKSFGLTVLALMVCRVIWMVYRGRPPLPPTVPVWQVMLARSVQYGLYLVLFAMPLTGLIMSVAANKAPVYFGLFTVTLPIGPDKILAKYMNESHTVIAWIIIALIALHLAGNIKHYFIDKDRVLQRMLPGRRD